MGRIDDPEHLQQLEMELEQREYEISLLRETTFAIGSELDLESAFNIIAERARLLINARTLLIPILDENCTEYTYRAGAGDNVEEIVGESLPIEFGVCGWVWRHRKPWWRGVLDELTEEERNSWEKEAGTLILVPLVGRKHFLGGLVGINKIDGEEFTKRDLHILELFAGQVAIAIENAMAMDKLERAMHATETYQAELKALNQRLTSVNHELEHRSLYDQLTGLPNRSLFRDRLNRAIERAEEKGETLSILMIDLDHFQDINDAYGHDEGDRLLKEVSKRFGKTIGQMDSLCRMTSDEFAVLLPNSTQASAMDMAVKLQKCLNARINLSHQEVLVSATIGIAFYPLHGTDNSQLLKHADSAVSVAKRGRQPVHVFEESNDEDAPGRLAMIRDLQSALEQSEFELHYQPKVELATGTIVGVEALARWPHEELGYVPTEMFINAMEQTGLISPFSDWVLKQALQKRAEYIQKGWDLKVAVNLPVTVILEEGFVQRLAGLLAEYGENDGLILEITENIFLSDYDRLSDLMHELRAMGMIFSIDDFGTGHSSLSRLRQLPVAELKIDRSFIMDLLSSQDDEVIVKSTIELAHNLGIQICAEGVETAEIMQQLYRWRCDMIQGYHISKALPANELEAFIESSRWVAAPCAKGTGTTRGASPG